MNESYDVSRQEAIRQLHTSSRLFRQICQRYQDHIGPVREMVTKDQMAVLGKVLAMRAAGTPETDIVKAIGKLRVHHAEGTDHALREADSTAPERSEAGQDAIEQAGTEPVEAESGAEEHGSEAIETAGRAAIEPPGDTRESEPVHAMSDPALEIIAAAADAAAAKALQSIPPLTLDRLDSLQDGDLIERLHTLSTVIEKAEERREQDRDRLLTALMRTQQEISHLRYELAAKTGRKSRKQGLLQRLLG